MFKFAFSESDSRVTQRVTRARRKLLPNSFNCAFTSIRSSIKVKYTKKTIDNRVQYAIQYVFKRGY